MSTRVVRCISRIGGLTLMGLAGLALATEATPRLKYRAKSPVCTCASGLGEAEISRALSGQESGPAARQPAPSGAAQGDDQHRRNVNEDVKQK